MFKYIGIFLLTLLLVGCSTPKAKFDIRTQTVAYKDLSNIQSPEGEPIIIAVYDFLDMTGQKKPGGNFASMSTAVTQGSYQLLIKALQDAGEGKWFRVVERTSLPSLLQERKLIRSTRQQVNAEGPEPLPPLLFAARILGIQSNRQYRQDIVTIILRLVNVQTGEVVLTTTVEKTIVSTSVGGDIFKYFDADTMLLEVEAGYARNEPVTFAIRKAIEKGVVDIINLGVDKGLWEFEPVKETEVPEIKDYVDTDIVVGLGEEGVEKTYEDYLIEKERAKEERKKKIQAEIQAEKEWNELDKQTEENADEKDNDGDSDSSSDTN